MFSSKIWISNLQAIIWRGIHLDNGIFTKIINTWKKPKNPLLYYCEIFYRALMSESRIRFSFKYLSADRAK